MQGSRESQTADKEDTAMGNDIDLASVVVKMMIVLRFFCICIIQSCYMILDPSGVYSCDLSRQKSDFVSLR